MLRPAGPRPGGSTFYMNHQAMKSVQAATRENTFSSGTHQDFPTP
jgi:hypothetical protein